MKLLVINTLLFLILLAGCTSRDSRAVELFDTARFEEKQNNLEHATVLYKKIVSTYPASPLAKEALARIEALNQKKP